MKGRKEKRKEGKKERREGGMEKRVEKILNVSMPTELPINILNVCLQYVD